MDITPLRKFCVLCGRIRDVNKKTYEPKQLILLVNDEKEELGVICDKCSAHLENGGVFNKPRK